MEQPLVSVITNSYNAERFLRGCIESMLAQSYADWEQIVIDCGSKDGSVELVRSMAHPRLRLIEVPFCGVAKGRNLGIAESRGEIVSILDADDANLPTRLEKQVARLAADPGLVAVGAGVVSNNEITGTKKTYVYSHESRHIRTLLLAGVDPVPHSTLTYRRSAWDAAGGYSEVLEKSEDYEFLLRLLSIGRLENVPEPLVRYTVHAASHTFKHKPKGRNETFYVALAVILRALDDVEGAARPTAERIEGWLDAIGQEGITALGGRWAYRALRENVPNLDLWGYRFLVTRWLTRIGKQKGAFTGVPGWEEAADPKAIAAFLAR